MYYRELLWLALLLARATRIKTGNAASSTTYWRVYKTPRNDVRCSVVSRRSCSMRPTDSSTP